MLPWQRHIRQLNHEKSCVVTFLLPFLATESRACHKLLVDEICQKGGVPKISQKVAQMVLRKKPKVAVCKESCSEPIIAFLFI